MVKVPFSYYADVNPDRELTKGQLLPFVEMAAVPVGGGPIRAQITRPYDGSGSRFQNGDTLFARITPCTENGKVTLVANLPGCGQGFGSTEFIVLAPKAATAEPGFVFQVAASAPVRNQAIARMLGSSGRQRVPNYFFEDELTLPLFSLEQQRKIASLLGSIDAAIEKTEAVIAATEKLRNALLEDLLTRGVPGWHTEWKQVAGIGMMPAGWEIVPLEAIADVERGKFSFRPRNETRFYGGVYPFIQTGDVVNSRGRVRSYTQTLNESGLKISRMFPAGTIVLTIAANIGATAIAEFPVAFPDSLVGIIPKRVDGRFLEYFLRTRKDFLNGLATQSAQKNINLQTLRPLLVALPPLDEQHVIAKALDAIHAREETERRVLTQLKDCKTKVATALLGGEVRVTDSAVGANEVPSA